MKIVVIILSIIVLTCIYFILDYIKRRKKAYNLKIDDIVRVFENEDKFEFATIIGMKMKNNKKIAICKFEDGRKEEINIMDLIY
jgi:low affinity Fe/Cu permease